MSYFNNGQLNLSSQEKTYYKKSKVIFTNGYKKQKSHSLYLNFKYGYMFCGDDFCFPKSETDFGSHLLEEDLTPESE